MTEIQEAVAPAGSPISAQDLQRSTAQGSLWTMVHTVVAVPIAFVANAIVARSLGPEAYGHLALITLSMAVAVCVTNVGVSDGIQQWGASAHAQGDSAGVDRILRASLGFHLTVQLPFLVVIALFLGRGQPPVVVAALLATAVIPPALCSSNLCISIENLTAPASRLTMLTNAVSQAAISVVAALSHSPVAVWSTRSAIGALATPANFLLLTPARRRVALQPQLPRKMPTGFWSFCVLTAAGSLLGLLVSSRSEIVVLQRFGSAESVGIYALAFGIAAQMRGPVEALLAPLAPSIAGILTVHPHLARATMLRSLRVASLVSALLLLLVPFIGAMIPFIYGADFSSSTSLLPALSVVALSQAMINPLMAFARAQKLGGLLLSGNLLALVVDLGIAVALTPPLGVWGAVAATVVAQLTTIGLLALFQIRRHLLTWPDLVGSSTPTLAAAAVIGILSADLHTSFFTQILAWIVGIGTWCCIMRRTLNDSFRSDISRIVPAVPLRIAKIVVPALRLLGVSQANPSAQLRSSVKPTIVVAPLISADTPDEPDRHLLLTALAKHTSVVSLQQSPNRQRYWPLMPRPRLEQLDDGSFIMKNALSVRTHRVGRHFWRVSTVLDGWWFRRAMRDAGLRDYVMWLTANDTVIVRGFRSSRLIYDCIPPDFAQMNQLGFDRTEAMLAGRAKVVFASAEFLRARMHALNQNTYLLPNGSTAVPEEPSTDGGPARPAALKAAKGAIAGYLGTIDWRFDAEYVASAAEALPEVTFAIVGRVNANQEAKVARLRRLPNVVMPGQVDRDEGIAYTRAFDLGLIPFISSDMNDAINPVKIYTYLAQGLPVVSTWIAECRANPFVTAALTEEEFAEAIRSGLTDDDSAARQARKEFAAANTWAHRADAAIAVLSANGLWD